MKEVTFIRRNIEKWKETEKVVEKADKMYSLGVTPSYFLKILLK